MNNQDRKALMARSEHCMQVLRLAMQFNHQAGLLNTACAIDPPIEPIPTCSLDKIKKARDKAANEAYASVEEAE